MNLQGTVQIDKAADILVKDGKCVALTGAGISVPSGIPDFRSAGGLWEQFNPEEYATSIAWNMDPEKVWYLFRAVAKMLMESKPNPGHVALGELEKMGILEAVITQNIDMLHQAGGSRNVVEFHGNGRDVYCTGCGRRFTGEEEIKFMQTTGLPECPDCGGNVRPDVVLFGEPIPTEAMIKAFTLTGGCKSMMVVGTSGMTAPASSLPFEAVKRGAKIIEINLSSTHVSSIADVSIFESVETALPGIVRSIMNKVK